MKNDLINRSVLLQKIQEDKEFLQKGLGRDDEYAYMSADSVMEKIKSMPAACDMDKVVEQLEECRKIMESPVQAECWGEECRSGDCTVCAFEKAIEIVKSGGIE